MDSLKTAARKESVYRRAEERVKIDRRRVVFLGTRAGEATSTTMSVVGSETLCTTRSHLRGTELDLGYSGTTSQSYTIRLRLDGWLGGMGI